MLTLKLRKSLARYGTKILAPGAGLVHAGVHGVISRAFYTP